MATYGDEYGLGFDGYHDGFGDAVYDFWVKG
jgi:hypothetical protein